MRGAAQCPLTEKAAVVTVALLHNIDEVVGTEGELLQVPPPPHHHIIT